MSFKPNSDQGAIYPKCQCCKTDDVELFVADYVKLSDDNVKRLKALPQNRTQQQIADAIVPDIICAVCAERYDVELLGELPWPPPVL